MENLHSIFYYPYASFTNPQVPLLKAAALYFDKIYILDPKKANIPGNRIGELAEGIELLEKEKILERVPPEEILHKYEAPITDAIRKDLQDPNFIEVCRSSGRERWKLALAKVPKELRDLSIYKGYDTSMKKLMGDLPRALSSEINEYVEGYDEDIEWPIGGHTVNINTREFDEGGQDIFVRDRVEYRFGDYPLPLVESIMINHALFGGLLHLESTPLTDDPFHYSVLNLKIKRAYELPELRKFVEDKAKVRQLKKDYLAANVLTDLDLAIIPLDLPFSDILAFRKECSEELNQARNHLGWLAREIQDKPWSEEFANELETRIIPSIHRELQRCENVRDSWWNRNKDRLGRVAGLVAAALPVVSLVITNTPTLPIPEIISSASGAVKPAYDLATIKGGRDEKLGAENGLTYYIKIKSRK
jgi:hypothetical protein